MGLMDKAKQALKGRSETIERGIDAAVKGADQRTKGKYRDKLQKGSAAAKQQVRKLDEDRGPGGLDEPGTGAPPPR